MELQDQDIYIYFGQAGTKHGGKGWSRLASNDPSILPMFGPSDITVAHTGFSRLAVIDLDVRNGVDGKATFRKVSHENGLRWPKTRITGSTENPGIHLGYRQNPACIVPTFIGLFPGIDVKADGNHVVVVPPTPRRIIIDPRPYTMIPLNNARFLQDAALRMSRARSHNHAVTPVGDADGYVRHNLDGLIQTLVNAPAGERHNVMVYVLHRIAEMKPSRQRHGLRMVRQAWDWDLNKPAAELEASIASIFGGTRRG